jgi:hypothetical protein
MIHRKIERACVNWNLLAQDWVWWQMFLTTVVNHRAGVHKSRPSGHRGA